MDLPIPPKAPLDPGGGGRAFAAREMLSKYDKQLGARMKTTKRLLAVLVVMGFIGSANAANWYVLTTVSGPTNIAFFDFDTIVKSKNTVTIWVKNYFSPGKGVDWTADKSIYFCKSRTHQLLAATLAYPNGHNTSDNKPGKIQEVIPGSHGEALLKIVCSPDFPSAAGGRGYQSMDGIEPELFSKTMFAQEAK